MYKISLFLMMLILFRLVLDKIQCKILFSFKELLDMFIKLIYTLVYSQ